MDTKQCFLFSMLRLRVEGRLLASNAGIVAHATDVTTAAVQRSRLRRDLRTRRNASRRRITMAC